MEEKQRELIQKTRRTIERLEDFYARGMVTEDEVYRHKTTLYVELKDAMDAIERKSPGQGKKYDWTELLEICGIKKEELL